MFDKYNCEYPLQYFEFKNKFKNTCLERYNVDHPFKYYEFQQKSRETCMERYGFPYAIQNGLIAEKALNNSYNLKIYTYPSTNEVVIQGYEFMAIDELIKDGFLEEDIITNRSEVHEIWWIDENNKNHRHYVDIFVKSINKCIEVKSNYTYGYNTPHVLLKKQASKYDYEIWIFDHKRNKTII